MDKRSSKTCAPGSEKPIQIKIIRQLPRETDKPTTDQVIYLL